jgi:ABC-type dipeptide/oligopeptide/nickel transport system permease component
LDQDYITNARSKGLRERYILRRYALRNAAIPTVTVVGLEIGALMGGAVVVEKVFAYPGMGSLILDSITARDYPLIQASILFFAVAFVAVNLGVDALYGVLDPRIRRR